MVETRACEFCGEEIEPGTGLLLVTNDGSRHHYCSSKCESNADLGRSPRDVEWAGREDETAEADDADEEPGAAEPATTDEPATPEEPAPKPAEDEGAEAEAEEVEEEEEESDAADEGTAEEAAEATEADDGADDAATEKAAGATDGDAAGATIPDGLDELEYEELQDLAKAHDIAANQSTEALVEELGAVRDDGDAGGE